MEANVCLRTRPLLAMRHHRKVVVHSSVRLPALQARPGPPPGAARVAVVGAGVVLACTLGAIYWKRARACQLPMYRSSPISQVGGGGDHRVDELVTIKELPSLLSEICRRTDSKPPGLAKIIDQCLIEQKVVNKGQSLLESVLEEKFPKNITNDDYNFGFVLILALISEKKYVKAEEYCSKLSSVKPQDSRPALLSPIIKMLMVMDSMLQSPNTLSTDDLKNKLKLVEKAWDDYKCMPEFTKAEPETSE